MHQQAGLKNHWSNLKVISRTVPSGLPQLQLDQDCMNLYSRTLDDTTKATQEKTRCFQAQSPRYAVLFLPNVNRNCWTNHWLIYHSSSSLSAHRCDVRDPLGQTAGSIATASCAWSRRSYPMRMESTYRDRSDLGVTRSGMPM